MKIEIKKEKSLPPEMKGSGKPMQDIKTDKAKALDYKKPIASRVIEIKEEKEEEKPKKNFRLIIPLAGIILIITFLFIYFFVFALSQNAILKFISPQTVFYFRLNLDKLFQKPYRQNLVSLVSKFSDFQDLEKETVKLIDQKFLSSYGLNFEKDVEPNLASEFIFALYYEKERKALLPYFVFTIKEPAKFREAINKIPAKKQEELSLAEGKIHTFLFENPGKNISFALPQNTVVLSPDRQVIEEVIKSSKINKLSFSQKLDFKSRKNNLVWLYLKTLDLPQEVFLNLANQSHLKNSFIYYDILKSRQNIYLKIKDKKDGLAFSFSSDSSGKKDKNFTSKLLPLLSSDAIFTFLGHNLKNEYQGLKELLPKNNDPQTKYFQNLEEKLKKQYNLDLEKDIFPFFEDEFAFVVLPKEKNKQSVVLLTKLKSSAPQEQIKKLKSILINYFATSSPKEEEMELADKTKAIEFLPDKKAFEIKKEKGETAIYNLIKRKGKETLVSYALKEDILIIGSNKEAVERIIGSNNKLVSKNIFQKPYKKIDGQKMENMIYINVLDYLGYLGKSDSSKTFWQPIKSFIFKTKTDKKGTTGEGFLLIE